MECSSCQHENPAEANFCLKCGAALTKACPKCGKEFPAEAAFCMACGHDLSQPAATPESPAASPVYEGERRQATVLFSDLSGYTAMNERLDPEEVEGIMVRIKAEAVKIVESHGGIVSQFVGDEVLALFGIPTAHEDDPCRAVRAALELHELARNMSPEVEERIGRSLRMHTGINSGLVVTSSRDVRDGTVGVTGDAVNIGARLKAIAQDDKVLISPETGRLIAPFYTTEMLEPVTFKGKDQPIIPFQVTGESGVQNRFEAAEQKGFTPFAGREEELGTLHACMEKVIAGQGQFVTVHGEAGIGKTRLLHEFRHSLDREKISVLEGRCTTYGGETSFLPFIDAMRRGLHLEENDTPQELLEKAVRNIRAIDPALENYIPHLLYLLSIQSGEHALPQYLQGEELKRALQEALAAMITLNTRHKPMVYIMEDWHWADQASEAALKNLIGLSAHFPLMVIAVYRPEFSRTWGNPEQYTPIVVKPLELANTEEIIRSVLGAETLPEGLASLTHERTGGNPFFIEEVCHSLVEEGTVEVQDDKAVLNRPLDAVRLPDSVHAVIRARVDRLDPEPREVLRMASVIGREFTQGILERVHKAKSMLPAALERLKEQNLVQQVQVVPEPKYAFKSLLTQVVVYETLLLERRKKLHALVGTATESIYDQRLEEHTEALAYHFEKGQNWEKATGYLLQAAEKAKAHYAYRGAADLCQRALVGAGKGEGLGEERVRGLVLAGDVASLQGELEEANQNYDQALQATEEPEKRQYIANKRHRPHSVVRDGSKTAYYEHGGGEETLLFIHPIAYGLSILQPVLEKLCQEFRIITLDPRGSGASDPMPKGFNLNDLMEDVRAVVEAADCGAINGIGISRGGNLLVKLAIAYPALVKSLITVGTGPDDLGPGSLYPPSGEWVKPFMEALIARDYGLAGKILFSVAFSEPGTEELAEIFSRRIANLPLASVKNFFGRDPETDIVPLLPKIAIPTLVVQGTDDKLNPFESGRYIWENIPNALFYPFEKGGHLSPYTAPGEFCEVLRQFVNTGKVPEIGGEQG